MQEKTIYVSEDGQRFDSAEDCQVWERTAQKRTQLSQMALYGLQDEENVTFPPIAVQEALELELTSDDLGNELYTREGVDFVRAVRHLKAVSDWLWE